MHSLLVLPLSGVFSNVRFVFLSLSFLMLIHCILKFFPLQICNFLFGKYNCQTFFNAVLKSNSQEILCVLVEVKVERLCLLIVNF